MDRGDEIKSRRRLLVMAVPVAAVGILVVGVMALRPDPGGALLANPSADAVAAANAALSVGETIYDWETEPASLGWTMQQSVSDGVMYALSTAPGTRWEQFPNGDIPEAIYTSTDGLSWTSHLAESTWMNSIAATDGLLYAVGTAPGAEADSITVQVGVSSDMGETFTTTGLPFAVPAPGFTDTRVLANGSGVLALVTHTASTDPWSLIPSQELEGNVEPLVLQDGIAVFPSGVLGEAEAACFSGDTTACEDFVEAEATYDATWEELGLGEDVFFGEQTTQAAYFSRDGVDFEEIDHPLPDGWIEKAVTVADSAVVSISGGAGSNLLASKDLRSWQPVAAEFGAGWILDIGQVDDTVVAVGSSPQGDRPVVYRADDLYGAWSEVRVGDLLPPVDQQQQRLWLNSAAVGPGGVAINFVGEVDASGGNPIGDILGRLIPGRADEEVAGGMTQASVLLVSRDLAAWNVVPGGDAGGAIDTLTFNPAGDLIATFSSFENGQAQRFSARATPSP